MHRRTSFAGKLRPSFRPLAFVLALAAPAGCGGGYSAGGDFLGATPGGAQDIGLARSIIESGGVPTLDDFTPEGLYSEHDLALAAPTLCAKPLCIDTAAGLDVGLDDDARDIFVQLGMQSNIREDEFVRKPLNLGIVIDTSGSMEGNLPHVRDALHALVDHLRPDDRVAIVEFASSANTIQESTPVSDKESLHAAVDEITTGGSTSMEEGMMLGYAVIDEHVQRDTLSRLMVFTDAMPNVGATDAASFQSMVTAASALDIGFTFFGFGSDFDASFVDQIAHLRGGNYRFVGAEDVKPIFEEELDFLVTPIAYDLKVSTAAAEGTEVSDVYGVPQIGEHGSGKLFDVSTVFLSKRKGGIVLRLDGSNLEPLVSGEAIEAGSVTIEYETPEGVLEKDTLSMRLPFQTLPGPTDALLPTPHIARTLAVTNEYLVLKRLCGDYHTGSLDAEDAAARLEGAIARLTSADAALSDENLKREITLLQKLGQNLGLVVETP
ncbi:vWA domain-containing protein [Polyangium jinanense]|uniref:VWA domain-containing protein n=1 Tax=Polyangium jinanense TaxID=2829994 RepID=A0A9X3XC68_9BACT|nr:VWA domain-containing protein [Polyangium jinanense]MDC3958703.1 VWA domain-containing protein [Polyangium jinanense]MDC3985316.1 VWA domain-containing protein [Polyangium jinanense]